MYLDNTVLLAVCACVRMCARARACVCIVWCVVSFYNFSRLLLKVGEHTWGLDVKHYLGDYTHWSNDKVREAQPRTTQSTSIISLVQNSLVLPV